MPQALLPLLPDGATHINPRVSIVRENGRWTWFHGIQPVFAHPENDRPSFRMFAAQLVDQGACRQVEIIRTFGISKNSIKRDVKKYREQGIQSFYLPRKGRGPTVMTPSVIQQAQQLLDQGTSRKEVGRQLEIKDDTLRKTIQLGRLHEPSPQTASDKSHRSRQDADAAEGLGIACTRPGERVLASLGMLQGAPTRFESCRGVSFGGVLCALPALAENGLFRHLAEALPTLTGYYTRLHVVVLLAFMALARIKTVEQLQYESPGELGKLLGLDRVPEVRCLRNKLAQLSTDDAPQQWAALLSKDWLETAPELAGTLYVDGHVRLYHGKQTKLPRRYVARQRLCLRGTTDYWVNDAEGRPFFVVERPADHGMLEAIRNDIVPRLLEEVPRQPSAQELKDDLHRYRFVMVFDREGYSPVFFQEMWQQHRIACITYHKFPRKDWPESEFVTSEVTLGNGETVALKLAERGSQLGGQGLWLREVRKLNASGHQTSLISTAYGHDALQDAGSLFSRWSQENFFRYMMQHYAIDLLSEYQTEVMTGTNRPLVNRAWRELDNRCRSLKGKLTQRQARFAALTLHPETDEKELEQWQRDKADLVDQIEQLEQELSELKVEIKSTPKHLDWEDLPEEDQFERLAPSRKRLMDTVKMIAYRAETGLAEILRGELPRRDDARSLVRELCRTEADLIPDVSAGTLEVRVHTLSNPRSNRALSSLLSHLNATEFTYPGTKLKLLYTQIAEPLT